MASAADWVLAAGALSLANEALFAPLATGKTPFASVNWRIVPATAILAVTLTALDHLLPGYGRGLAVLGLLAVIILPVGNAPTPIESVSQALGYTPKTK